MEAEAFSIVCDGCGLPASPEHIAARMERLELVTRFRPIHIHLLFVAFDPMPRLEDDFYKPPESRDFFDSFLSAMNISPDAEGRGPHLETAEISPQAESTGRDAGPAMLLEFQRRGYYLTYLSECPVTPEHSANVHAARRSRDQDQLQRLKPTEGESGSAGLKPGPPRRSETSTHGTTNVEVKREVTNLGITHDAANLGISRGAANLGIDGTQVSAARECISRLAPTLIKRIRFNYRPKHVVLLGTHLSPLIGVFEDAGLGPLLLLDRGAPLTIPGTGDGSSLALFRRAVNIETPFSTTSSGL